MKRKDESRPSYVTVNEAAEIIGVSPRQVLNYVKAGRLGDFSAGRCVITEAEAREFERPPRGNPNFTTGRE